MPPRKSSGSPYARSICRFGDHVIEQENPGDPWYDSTSMLGGYLNRECPGAPNPRRGTDARARARRDRRQSLAEGRAGASAVNREDLSQGQEVMVTTPGWRRGERREERAVVVKVSRVNVLLCLTEGPHSGTEMSFRIDTQKKNGYSGVEHYAPYFMTMEDWELARRESHANIVLARHGIQLERRSFSLSLPAATLEQRERLGRAADEIFGEE